MSGRTAQMRSGPGLRTTDGALALPTSSLQPPVPSRSGATRRYSGSTVVCFTSVSAIDEVIDCTFGSFDR